MNIESSSGGRGGDVSYNKTSQPSIEDLSGGQLLGHDSFLCSLQSEDFLKSFCYRYFQVKTRRRGV